MAVEWDEGLDDLGGPEAFTVLSPNGVELELSGQSEVKVYEKMRDEILAAYDFTDPSDMADLDNILLLELSLYRVHRTLSTGVTAMGLPLNGVDERRLHQSVNDLGTRLQKAKDALGISRTAREKSDNDSVAGYLDELRTRALEFAVHRNNQAQMSIALLMETISIADTFLRSNELERSKLGMQEAEDVLRWITTTIQHQFDSLDTEFIKDNQRYWVERI